MNDFALWFETGVLHIADLKAYDHILFVSLIAFSYPISDWKKTALLVTGFTIGHSVSLALSVFHIVHLPSYYTEIWIAITILSTAAFHILHFKDQKPRHEKYLWMIIPFFGGIHGLGFSSLLRSMLGETEDKCLPLLCFNLGLEAGQLFILTTVLLFSLLLTRIFHYPFRNVKLFISCIIAITSVYLIWQRL